MLKYHKKDNIMSLRRKLISPQDLKERSEYIRKLFCHEHKALLAAKNRAEKIYPEMMISPQEGKILQCLIKSLQAQKVIEIGAFTGYSALWIVQALPSNGQFWTLELQKENAHLAELSLSEGRPSCQYHVLQGPADESLKTLEKHAPFDVIFIDANKEGYIQYLDWTEKHLRKGGLIIGDNAYLFGHVYKKDKPEDVSRGAWESMRKFNKRLSDSKKYTSTILPTPEGMAIAIKEF